ncbi:MAG: hypothetical protein ACT4ON_04200 [Bacteroidota bacterium]
MTEEKEHLQAISDIRSMMERSSRFISLSGLSGVFAGLFALCGAYAAHKLISNAQIIAAFDDDFDWGPVCEYLLLDAALVLFLSITVGVLFTIRASKRKGIKIWDATSKRLLINLMIPLVTGGIFSLILLSHKNVGLIAPVMLIFYGLALINASKYTLNDIRYLGFCEILLGLTAAANVKYGLLIWAIGFGLLHIIYGTVMYFKYERN